MNILFVLVLSGLMFLLASKIYGRYIGKFFGIDGSRPTPAVLKCDGRDYVPTRGHVVFANHFSAIAGAGPILGPTLAMLYGFFPAWMWVIIGGIFMGAVHDFSALFASLREGGKSVAEIARKSMGQWGFIFFISFTIIMIVLVTSSFLRATSMALTSLWPLEKLGLGPEQTLLKTVVSPKGEVLGRIGGIASTSVIIITFMAPFLGFLLFKRNLDTKVAYPLATVIMVASVITGFHLPLSLSPTLWMLILTLYVTIAAGVPLWVILQPREFINVQILYGGIGILFLSLLIGGLKSLPMSAPNTNVVEGVKNLGFIWPMLFVTVACGAISGFHALVASGTTSKQINNECSIKPIGYDGMLLESILALAVLLVISCGLDFRDYKALVWPDANSGHTSNPVLAFSLAMGSLLKQTIHLHKAFGTILGILLVEGFVITTLDMAVRINRYLFEELWGVILKNPPRLMRSFWFNSGLSALIMWIFAYSNAFSAIWPLFGSANQLLAALTLTSVALWFMSMGRVPWFILAPAAFMMATTMASLIILLVRNIEARSLTLTFADLLMLALSCGVIALFVKVISGLRLQKAIK